MRQSSRGTRITLHGRAVLPESKRPQRVRRGFGIRGDLGRNRQRLEGAKP